MVVIPANGLTGLTKPVRELILLRPVWTLVPMGVVVVPKGKVVIPLMPLNVVAGLATKVPVVPLFWTKVPLNEGTKLPLTKAPALKMGVPFWKKKGVWADAELIARISTERVVLVSIVLQSEAIVEFMRGLEFKLFVYNYSIKRDLN